MLSSVKNNVILRGFYRFRLNGRWDFTYDPAEGAQRAINDFTQGSFYLNSVFSGAFPVTESILGVIFQ